MKHLQIALFFILFSIAGFALEAKEGGKDSKFRRERKAELNIHLNGAYPLDYLLTIATPEQKEKLEKVLHRVGKDVPYQEFFRAFRIVEEIVDTEEKVEDGVVALCKALEDDGVSYAEIRTKLREVGDCDCYIRSILKGIRRGCSEKFSARLILSIHRDSTFEFVRKTIDLAIRYQNQGVVAIDISGDTLIGNVERLFHEIWRAKNEGLFLTVHMGESPLEHDQVWILQNLLPDRIAQGVYLVPEAWDLVWRGRIPIEVCLTASERMELVDDYTENPGIEYALRGHPIVICTDDPLIFRTSLSHELCLFYETTLFLQEQVDWIARESFRYAFNGGFGHILDGHDDHDGHHDHNQDHEDGMGSWEMRN